MFAVVKTGGKQYKVSPGDVLLVERLQGEAGDTITLNDVLMVSDEKGALVGAPSLAKAAVTATIREQARGKKIIVFKKKRRQGYRRTAGHRQDLTVLTIDEIRPEGKALAAKKAAAPKETTPKGKGTPKASPQEDAKTAVKLKPEAATKKPGAPAKAEESMATEPGVKSPTKKAAAKDKATVSKAKASSSSKASSSKAPPKAAKSSGPKATASGAQAAAKGKAAVKTKASGAQAAGTKKGATQTSKVTKDASEGTGTAKKKEGAKKTASSSKKKTDKKES